MDDSWKAWPCLLSTREPGRPYPRKVINGVAYKESRLAFKSLHGNFPVNHACHHCDNPRCIEPHHIFDGDQKANCQDAARKGRMARGIRSGKGKQAYVVRRRVMDLRAKSFRIVDIAGFIGINTCLVYKHLARARKDGYVI